MARVLLGSGRLSVDDLVSIAFGRCGVDLDPAAVNKLQVVLEQQANKKPQQAQRAGKSQTESKDKDKVQTKDTSSQQQQQQQPCVTPAVASHSEVFGVPEVRAIIAIRLNRLLDETSGFRIEVLQYLADILNRQITPALLVGDSEEQVLNHLLCLFDGHGTSRYNNETLSTQEILNKLKITPPTLTAHERATLVQGLHVSCALSALSVAAAATLIDVADAVGALTCEAVEAFTESFQQTYHDQSRPHKGQAESANHLRVLLEDSRCVNVSKRTTYDPVSIRQLPQYHGPAREVYKTCYQSVRIELNSSDVVLGQTSKHIGVYHPQPLIVHMSSLFGALFTLATGSQERIQDLVKMCNLATQANDASASFSGPLLAVQATIDTLRVEIAKVSAAGFSFAGASDAKQEDVLSTIRVLNLVKESTAHVQNVLAIETTVALHAIAVKDKQALEASALAIARKAEAMAKRAAQGKKTTEESKDDKKPKGIQLGKGTQALRTYLCEASYPTAADQVCVNDEALQQRLNSYKQQLNLYSQVLKELLDKLYTALSEICEPKVAKGTQDFGPFQMAVREKVFAMILSVFHKHNAVGIDTPVFERKDILSNKYGEDSKLIYDLADQGGELLSLRYDLTVPFARYIASHNVDKIKRYHIARVYRRDNPAMNRGRFREFYQCDFDVAGKYPKMVPDAEVLKVLTDILDKLNIGHFKVKLNHRKLLDAIMNVCGVPAAKFRTICSAIDKLDKEPWSVVKQEMLEKGLAEPAADAIGTYVCQASDPRQMLEKLRADARLSQNEWAASAFEDLGLLIEYLTAFKCLHHFSLDMSLARGLDYYTGVIYEAMLTTTGEESKVGSIAAGGRYDNLVGMFSRNQVPAVGVSIGIERIFRLVEQQEMQRQQLREVKTHVMIVSTGKNMLNHRMTLCNELWERDVIADFWYDDKTKLTSQLEGAARNRVPFAIILGEAEIKGGFVKFKTMATHQEEVVPRDQVIEKMLDVISKPYQLPSKPAETSQDDEKGDK